MDTFDESMVQRTFLFSNIPSRTERENLRQKIEDLGGLCIDSKIFDASVSHVIFGRLSRNEKFIGACITGKQILSPKYIEDSHEVQMWLDEEDYEFSVSDQSQPVGLVSAAKRWKWKKSMCESHPFADWHVSLYMNAKKMACFQRILECGGAKTVAYEASRETLDVAFVLVDSQKYHEVPKLQEDVDILYIREDFVADHIMMDPEPDLFDYVVDKDSNKQKVVTAFESSFLESKVPQSSVKTDVISGRDNEIQEENFVLCSTNDDGAIRTTVWNSTCRSKTLCKEDIPNRTPSKNSECNVETPSKGTPVQTPKKGKRTLKLYDSEKTYLQNNLDDKFTVIDNGNPQVKKRKTNHVDRHKSVLFSPKLLRSRKGQPPKTKSEPMEIYEDKSETEKDFQSSLNAAKCISRKNIPKVARNIEEIQDNFGESSFVSISTFLKTGEHPVSSSMPSTSSSEDNLHNIHDSEETISTPSNEEFSVRDVIHNSQSSGSASHTDVPTSDIDIQSSRLNKKSLNKLSKHSEDKVVEISSSENLKEEKHKSSLEGKDKSSRFNSKKPAQMSLERFGFFKTPNKDEQIPESPRIKLGTASTSSLVTIKSEPVTPAKSVKRKINICNTPDTPIVLDDDSEDGNLVDFFYPSSNSNSEHVMKRQRSSQSETSKSDGESYEDLLKEVMILCEDDDKSNSSLPESHMDEPKQTITYDCVTYHEVCCDDTDTDVHDTPTTDGERKVVQSKKDLATDGRRKKEVGGVKGQILKEAEDMHVAENIIQIVGDSTKRAIETDFSESKESSVTQQIQKQSCKVSSNGLVRSLKAALSGESNESKPCNVCDFNQTQLNNAEGRCLHNHDLPHTSQHILSPLNAASYSYLASEVSLPLNPVHWDGCGEKSATSPLIGQWMQTCREMKFFSTSLGHGRPDFNQKPTTEVLSELMSLLVCECSRTRNVAFHYLMVWFETNPPTSPVNIAFYTDVLCLNTSQTFMVDLLETLTSSPKSEGHRLLLDFIVAVLEVNFQHHSNSGNKSAIKECLLIKWLWFYSSNRVHFNTSVIFVLEAFGAILSLKSSNCQSMVTLLGLISECLRLEGNGWNIRNFSRLSDCMISFCVHVAKKIKDAFKDGDESYTILILQSLEPAWLRTLVTASILSNFNDFLVMEAIQISNISLSSIVTQYFFLLPLLSSKPLEGLRVVLEKLDVSEKSPKIKVCDKTSSLPLKVNKRKATGESAVHVAAKRKDGTRLKQLLSIPGVDVNLKDYSGWTPLHEACIHGSYACVELLLNHVPAMNLIFGDTDDLNKRVDIHAKGFYERTPLHDAVVKNNVHICKLLLEYGGPKLLDAKTIDGLTPLDLVRTDEMKTLLLEHHSVRERSQSSTSQSQTNLMLSNYGMPSSSLYDKVLRTDENHFHVDAKNCMWFLSLLSLLTSSYMQYACLKGHQSPDSQDMTVVNNIDGHIDCLQEHLRKITCAKTFKDLQFQVRMLKAVVSEFSV